MAWNLGPWIGFLASWPLGHCSTKLQSVHKICSKTPFAEFFLEKVTGLWKKDSTVSVFLRIVRDLLQLILCKTHKNSRFWISCATYGLLIIATPCLLYFDQNIYFHFSFQPTVREIFSLAFWTSLLKLQSWKLKTHW